MIRVLVLLACMTYVVAQKRREWLRDSIAREVFSNTQANMGSQFFRKRDISLLAEPGYHNCPTWAGGHHCAEGYLCGDGNNGCAYAECCNEDPELAICLSQEKSPCAASANSADGDYHCCGATGGAEQICGDGSSCTHNCAKGECCDFDPSKVSPDCGYAAPEVQCPNDDLTKACCDAPWDLEGNRVVDNGRGDYSFSNADCFAGTTYFERYTDETGHSTLVLDCNYGLNSFEYVCQHEQGAICAFQIDFNLTMTIEETPIKQHFRTIQYECIATECDTNPNEDLLELVYEKQFQDEIDAQNDYSISDMDITIDCDSLPDNYDEAKCSGLRMQGDNVKFCDSLSREECTSDTAVDMCGKCVPGYEAPSSGGNAACFKKSIVESHNINGHMESAGIVFITMIVTLVVAGFLAYGMYRYRKKQRTQFIQAGQSKLIKTEPPLVPALQEMPLSASASSGGFEEPPPSDESSLIANH